MTDSASSMRRFSGRVVLVTGGTSGIGRAAARLFAQDGAQVAFTGRRRERGAAVVAEIEAAGGQALCLRADHTRLEDCERAVAEALAAFGRIDVLFNNAGVVLSGTAETTSEADWQLTLDLNVTAAWRMSRLVIPVMRRQGGGVIVNNASDWGLVGAENALAYCVSKGAVVQMTRCLALDHARDHIRVNAVCPGDTYVERWSENGYFRGSGPVDRAAADREAAGHLPLGRVAGAEEIAQAVLFLAGDESAYMTGATLVVDGGNTAR